MSSNQPKAQVNIDLNAIPNEVCGAEPEQQAFKQGKMGWLCEKCYGQLKDHPGVKMIPNVEKEPCSKCGQTGKNYCRVPETCTSTQFTKVFQFKRLSALVSPTGREQVIELQFTKCLACGAAKVIK